MSKILLVIAFEGYQPHEYGRPKNILEGAGHEVFTVSNKLGEAKAAYDNSSTTVDIKIEDVKVGEYDGLFFVGGPGALDHLDNETSYSLLKKWQEAGKPYGAICVSPRILAKAGVLKNKKATGWDLDDELGKIFTENDVEYQRESVVIDGNVVTGNGPEVAEEFGLAISQVL